MIGIKEAFEKSFSGIVLPDFGKPSNRAP